MGNQIKKNITSYQKKKKLMDGYFYRRLRVIKEECKKEL